MPLNASFEKRFHKFYNSSFYTEIDDHGVHRGDTGQIIALWRRPVTSRVALDLLHSAVRSAPHQRIIMAIKMAHDGNTFVQ